MAPHNINLNLVIILVLNFTVVDVLKKALQKDFISSFERYNQFYLFLLKKPTVSYRMAFQENFKRFTEKHS